MTALHAAGSHDVGRSISAAWRIEPQSWFSRHFDLYQDEKFITTLQMQFWQEGCDFTIADHDFSIRKASLWKDAFQLLSGGESVCDGKRSFWSRRFELTSTQDTWTLQPAGWLSMAYQFLAGSREAGRIAHAHWWSRRQVAWFHHNVPPPVQVLAIFLVVIIRQRRSRSK
jgi:hypothetical protein